MWHRFQQLFFCTLLFTGCTKNQPIEKKFEYSGIKSDTLTYAEAKDVTGASEKTVFKSRAADTEIHVNRLQPLHGGSFEQTVNAKTAVILNLFAEKPVPYRGEVSKVKMCPDEFRPHISDLRSEHSRRKIITMFANSRYVPGICAKPQVFYQMSWMFIDCLPAGPIYEIKMFSHGLSREALEKLAATIDCGSV
jgi:hypothetical protein